jgi:hypothetical protein
MAREPRIEMPGGFYHVGSKGNRGCTIYEDDFERRVFSVSFEPSSVGSSGRVTPSSSCPITFTS